MINLFTKKVVIPGVLVVCLSVCLVEVETILIYEDISCKFLLVIWNWSSRSACGSMSTPYTFTCDCEKKLGLYILSAPVLQ